MPKSYLWALDETGIVFYLTSWDNHWQKIECSVSKINQFKLVSASLWSLWSVGIDNQIYLYVPTPEIKIRAFDIIIENQRKEFGRYSGSNLRSQDPPEFSTSNYYGKLVKSDLKTFSLPSTRWIWEDVWKIKKSFNGEITEDGWIYSSSFMQKFQNHQTRLSTAVRRRYWQRCRYFHASERWLFIGQDNDPFEITCNQEFEMDLNLRDKCVDYNQSGIIDIGCGGEMLPHQKDGFIAVWTINEDGQVLYRLDVHRQNPEGSHWCLVKLPKHVKATCLSVGPLGHLLVNCSHGEIYFRENITWKNTIGSSWVPLNPPEDLIEGETIVQISMSVYTIWVRSNHNRVWYRSGVNLHEIKSSLAIGKTWVISAYNITWISSSPSGQLWGLAVNGNGILYRLSSNLIIKERFWSGFINLMFGFGDKVSSTRLAMVSAHGLFLEDNRMPSVWLQSPIGPRVFCNNENDQDMDWRKKIMDSLITRDYMEFKNPTFSNLTSLPEQLSWSKATYCQAQSLLSKAPTSRWLPANAVLHHKLRDNKNIATMHVNITRIGISNPDMISFIESDEITCASKYSTMFRCSLLERCETLVVFIRRKGYKSTSDKTQELIPRLLLKFTSETEVEDWILALHFVMSSDRRNNVDRSDLGKIWFINQFYEPFHVSTSDTDESLGRSYQNGGHFRIVESCAKGRVTWALGFNGIAWVNSNGWGGSYLGLICSSKEDLNTTFDVRSIVVNEYEKLKLMPRLTSGMFSQYMWTDEYGNIIRNKESVKLASRRWQWCGDWSIDYGIDDGDCDPEGWQYSTSISHKFDSYMAWSKNFRRRRWIRNYKTSVTGPWKEVLNDFMKITDITLSSEYLLGFTDNYKCVAWAVTKDGLLLRRKGVTISCPEGFEWLQVRTDLKIVSVSINKVGDLWVVCKHGSVWRLRQSVNRDTKRVNDLDWEIAKHPSNDGKFTMVSSGDQSSVWAIDSSNHLWTRMFTNINSTPIGDSWIYVCDQIIHVSCNSQQKVFVLFTGGCLAERKGISKKVPQGTSWRYDMDGIATYISIRGA